MFLPHLSRWIPGELCGSVGHRLEGCGYRDVHFPKGPDAGRGRTETSSGGSQGSRTLRIWGDPPSVGLPVPETVDVGSVRTSGVPTHPPKERR